MTEKKKQQDKEAPPVDKEATPPDKDAPTSPENRMPAPWALGMAVLGTLALGVLIGSVTDHYAQNAGFPTVLLESSEPPPEEAAPETAAAEPAEAEASGGESAPVAAPSAVPAETPLVEEPLPESPKPEVPLVEEELPTGLPEVKHVFVVMQKEGSFEAPPATTAKRPSPSRAKRSFPTKAKASAAPAGLIQQGELLTNYYAVTKGALANQIALLSGQGPTPETAANCPNYADVVPGTESAEGQVEGNGCVYPAATETLPGQLAEAGLKWKAYIQGIEGGAAAGQPTACRHPAPGTPDPNLTATPSDAYETWRNPFVYFHSIVDAPECAEANVGLSQLAADLKLKAERFPALAYIAPDEAQLEAVVTEIKKSLAYKDGGMIVVTSAQAPQEGEKPDASGCCIDPDFPNLPDDGGEAPPSGPVRETNGGGRVGLLLLSPYVEPGTTSETYFNHFSLLVTIEELFELERLGYGAEPALTGFDESIFNAAG
ncbi:MAG TPA: alkaline phosphatase family protein [Solirubrobacterales bacterium]|nr:alkaline phosphatase family protein [Solirubrobacterales bacterium]